MKKMKRRNRSERGVTLIEMLVVVTIIGLIAAAVTVNVFKQGDVAKRKLALSQINDFKGELGFYKFDTGSYPPTEVGLHALRVQPENVANWGGPYITQDIGPDPWGRPYLYKYPGDHGEEPDIISLGADGQPGGDGANADIVSWSNK
jgi:general secretion pathway protein G